MMRRIVRRGLYSQAAAAIRADESATAICKRVVAAYERGDYVAAQRGVDRLCATVPACARLWAVLKVIYP